MGSSDKGRQTNCSILVLEYAQPWRFGNRDGRWVLSKADGFFGTQYFPKSIHSFRCPETELPRDNLCENLLSTGDNDTVNFAELITASNSQKYSIDLPISAIQETRMLTLNKGWI